jgi:DNA-binding transcriptional LysR family regulator
METVMELRHLRYFIAVAETGSLSRAAEKLFIAQPPLSVQIRQLEDELGAALFMRHPKGVRLTAAGEALLPEARHLVQRAERLRDLVAPGQGGGSLVLGFVPSAAGTVIPSLVRTLRERLPALALELVEAISSEQVEALVAGRIDLGLARAPVRHPRLHVACQMPDPFCLASAADEAALQPGAVDLRAYAERDFVSFTRHRGPAYFDQSIHLCTQAGFSPRIRYEASTVHGVLDLVGAGLGVALVPASTALLPQRGALLRRLGRTGGHEALVLLRRKGDERPTAAVVEQEVAAIFQALARQLAQRVG